MLPPSFLSLIAKGMNHYLHLDPDVNDLLKPLAGKVIVVKAKPLFNFIFAIDSTGVTLLGHRPTNIDCEISGPLFDLIRLTLSEKPLPLSKSGVKINGDVEVAQHWGELFSRLNIDWEEYLAHIVGDPIAHQVGNTVRHTGGWLQQIANTLTVNLKEYMQEEVQYVPSDYEVDEFLGSVDDLRSHLDRLSLRVERLQKQKD